MSRRSPPELAQVRGIPAFEKTSTAVLSSLIRLSPRVAFAPGEVLVHQGETTDFAMIVLAGVVSVINESQHGQAILAEVPAPALVGEIGALARLKRTAGVVAKTPVEALRVEREILLDACRGSTDIMTSVVRQMGGYVESVNHALGLYANGFAALERDDFDPALLEDLNNPTQEVRNFADAFQRLAGRITLERRKRGEMASAALIQRAMLPQGLDKLPLGGRCQVFGAMTPARDVGGDFYDVFKIDDDRLALTIGDVCGKGVPASLFMSQTMTTLRMAAQQGASVSAMLENANNVLCAQNPSMMFSTALYGVLDLSDGWFEYANCGHSAPLLLRAGGGCETLPGGGSPLGIVPGKTIPSHTTTLRRGDGLFLFTDGVTESIDPAGEEYGVERLEALLGRRHGRDASAMISAVMADVARFVAGAEPFDDITCLAAFLA